MLMGAWVGSDKVSTRNELDTLIKLAKENQDVVDAVIVGNEVLLRGDITSSKLYDYIKEVKVALPNTKVTYADVWEFWLLNPKIKEVTDFVTVHILPYWEDNPLNIDEAIEHLVKVRLDVEKSLGSKNILIGETGWPSEGRMREDVLPSKINQALFVREFVKVAEDYNWNYNIIEAFDQPWKRLKEGTVGGYWGLFDKDRADKNVFKGEISNFPNYEYLILGSLILILSFSYFFRKNSLSTKELVLFAVVNTAFSILFILQVEQYFITVRNGFELVWALFILFVHIFIYYYTLKSIINSKCSIPISLFYFTLFFIVVINIKLAIEGRYQNFEVYAFVISSLSFLFLLKNSFGKLGFNGFEKLLSVILVITSIIILKNETILNIFSNIWLLITLVFIFILYRGSKAITFYSIKNTIFYLIFFIIIAVFIRYGILMNEECGNLTCQLRDLIGVSVHNNIFGLIAIFTSIIAFFIKNKFTTLSSLFFTIVAIFLFNIFVGSVAFFLSLYLLEKRN